MQKLASFQLFLQHSAKLVNANSFILVQSMGDWIDFNRKLNYLTAGAGFGSAFFCLPVRSYILPLFAIINWSSAISAAPRLQTVPLCNCSWTEYGTPELMENKHVQVHKNGEFFLGMKRAEWPPPFSSGPPWGTLNEQFCGYLLSISLQVEQDSMTETDKKKSK